MATIESIRRIRVQHTSEGADTVRRDLVGLADAQQNVARATEAAAVVTESASRRQLSAAGAYDKLRASVDAGFRAQQQLERGTRTLERAFEQGIIDASGYDRTLGQLAARYDGVAAAARRAAEAQREGWRDLSTQGATALANLEASRRLGSLGRADAGSAANENRPGVAGYQLQNLFFQGGDIASSLGSGSSLGTVALQQGPQIAQSFMGPGAITFSALAETISSKFRSAVDRIAERFPGPADAAVARRAAPDAGGSTEKNVADAIEQESTAEALRRAAGRSEAFGSASANFVRQITFIGTGVAAITTALGTGAAALVSYRSQQRELQLSLSGAGRASQASVGQINAVAYDRSAGAGLSVSYARDMAGEFAATGRIGVEMYGDLLTAARDYAATTRQELPEATSALAAAFADPVKGADTLNAQLGFLNGEMQESIERMSASGDRLGAQRVLMDGLASSIVKADERLGFFARGWERFKVASSNEFDAIGRVLDRGFGGGAAEERLAALQGQLDFRQRNMGTAGGLFDRALGFDVDTIKAQIREVQAEIDRAAQQGQQAAGARRSLEIRRLVQSANPGNERLEELERSAENIRKMFRENWLDPFGAAGETMRGFEMAARRLREDLAAGGSELAASLRQAQFEGRQVGAVGLGRTAAEINEQFAERQRRIEADNPEPARRNEALQTLELERVTRLQTAERTATLAESAIGGVFSRMTGEVQRQIQDAATRYPRIPAGILAGIARPESGGNLDIGFSRALGEDGRRSSAYGLGQITRGTAEEAVRGGYLPPGFDRMNRETMAEGIAGVLSMKLDQNGGDLTRAIMAYRGSRDPSVNRAYAADVLRNSGQMGDVSATAQVRDTDARARALAVEQRAVALNTEFLGRNGEAFDAASRKAQLLADAQARGIPITADLEAEFDRLSKGGAAAARSLAGTRAGRDLDFDRDQLGRTDLDQRAYARARSIFGDTETGIAQAYIDASRLNDNLRLTKDLAGGAFSGMLTDLRQGAGFMDAIGNGAGRLADRLLSLAADRAVSGLFGALLGGGGSNPLASLFGGGGDSPTGGVRLFDTGGYTGAGGRLEPAGIVHRGEVVWSQGDVARVGGVAVAEAMRRGFRGYDTGGVVGGAPTWMPPPANSGAAHGGGPSTGKTELHVYAGDKNEVRTTEGPQGVRHEIMIDKAVARALMEGPDTRNTLKRLGASRLTGR